MKNIFKSRFSLIAICIVLGILIGSFALCGCRRNHGLLEGMDTAQDKSPVKLDPLNPDNKQLIGVSDIASSLQNLGSSMGTDGNAITSSIAKALQTINPTQNMIPAQNNEVAPAESNKEKKEPFQVSKPLEWGAIKESEEETVNLTKWVSDAMRYSKGMGNEDKLNSYQYNNGPAIPLPEGEMFFFKDTKFDPSCCPGSYSSGKGCACLSKKQFQYLTMRAGNNTIPDNKTSYFNEF